MTVTIANTNLVDSFNTWRLNTNLAATTISNNVVTVSKTGAVRGGTTKGDGHIKGIFSAKDSYNTGTGLDKLNVDDNVSAIVDDPIEANFLQDFVKNVLADAPDDTPLEKYDVTRLLQQFIAGEFDSVTVKK